MSSDFNFKIDKSIPDGIVIAVNKNSQFGDARDHPCLVDGPKHNWYDLNDVYKKCSKCGMSYEKPATSGVFKL